jgi:type I restriction-modification system DNA methylase subunit
MISRKTSDLYFKKSFSKIMYQINRNNYHTKPKPSNIQTPLEVSKFIYELLKDKFSEGSLILDPCSGQGSLLSP